MIETKRSVLSSVGAETGLPAAYLQDRLQVNERRTAIIANIIRRRGVDPSTLNVLEVGSHLGLGLLTYKTTGQRIGIEYFSSNCHLAKLLADKSNENDLFYLQGSAAALPFGKGHFDLVYSHHVIEHIPVDLWSDYLREMSRIITQKGLAIVSFPQWHHPIEVHYRLPFLHWLPHHQRMRVLRLFPFHWWNHRTEVNSDGDVGLAFTEIPKSSEFRDLAGRHFSVIEDITHEFAIDPLIRKYLGQPRYLIAGLLVDTWLCSDRKFLLTKTR